MKTMIQTLIEQSSQPGLKKLLDWGKDKVFSDDDYIEIAETVRHAPYIPKKKPYVWISMCRHWGLVEWTEKRHRITETGRHFLAIAAFGEL